MKKSNKKMYHARWARVGHPSIASVSFEATSVEDAKKQANKIARDVGVTKTPRTIMQAGRVVEVIMTGVSE